MQEFIECFICHKKFKQIQHRHLKQHNITFEEYVKQFPDAPTQSEASFNKRSASFTGREITWADKISESNIKSWQNNPSQGRTGVSLSEESKKKLSEKLMGHSISQESRIKIGLAVLGREPWNKGLTKEDDNRLISVSEKIREWNKTHMTQEVKNQISQTLKRKYSDGMKIPQSKGGFRIDLNRYFRSKWEANYARILNYENKSWKYEEHQFTFYDNKGSIICVYTPDFYHADEFIEIKGHAESNFYWLCNCLRCNRDKLRVSLFLENHTDKKFRIIGKEEYKELTLKYDKVIKNWEKPGDLTHEKQNYVIEN